MKKIIFVNFSAIVGILSMMLLVSCSGGGGSSSSGGGSSAFGATVQGNVSEFNGVAMMVPGADQSRLAHALQSVSDTVLSRANASVAGVIVIICGKTATTGSNGYFKVQGVPTGGPCTIEMKSGDDTATKIINIPANAEEVYLNNVQVRGNNIFISGMRIESDDRSSDDPSSDDPSSDDPSSDDPSSDDDSSDVKPS
jgi:hypothetical protein